MKPICAVDGVLGHAPGRLIGICAHIKTGGSQCGSEQPCQHKLPDLHLNLKAEYFQQIRDNAKPEEYRQAVDYWKKRLIHRTYGRIILKSGYPSKDQKDRILYRRWNGCTEKTITHPEFGDRPVDVIAIDVSKEQ